jgi:hypothetical protein
LGTRKWCVLFFSMYALPTNCNARFFLRHSMSMSSSPLKTFLAGLLQSLSFITGDQPVMMLFSHLFLLHPYPVQCLLCLQTQVQAHLYGWENMPFHLRHHQGWYMPPSAQRKEQYTRFHTASQYVDSFTYFTLVTLIQNT